MLASRSTNQYIKYLKLTTASFIHTWHSQLHYKDHQYCYWRDESKLILQYNTAHGNIDSTMIDPVWYYGLSVLLLAFDEEDDDAQPRKKDSMSSNIIRFTDLLFAGLTLAVAICGLQPDWTPLLLLHGFFLIAFSAIFAHLICRPYL